MTSEDVVPARSPPVLSWTAAVVIAATMVLAAGVLMSAVSAGPTPPFLDDEASVEVGIERHQHADDLLHVAGSGSNLPLTRALARAFEATGTGQVIVHASIGSGGGIRAVHDGVIELGLASRGLTPAERALGLLETPYARTPVSLAAHPTIVDRDVTSDGLLQLYAGARETWSDGLRVVVLQREEGDSSHKAVAAVIPAFAEVNAAAYREGKWRVLHHDDAMRDALINTPGAVGLYGQGAITEGGSFHALRIDGVAPTVENMENGSYPFHKVLSFVTRGRPTGLTGRFIAFVQSEAGQAIVRSSGYAPVSEED